MSNQPQDGGPAFPLAGSSNYSYPPQDGMSLRDWFAGMALSGMMAFHSNERGDFHYNCDDETIAGCAYSYADAMLAARNGKEDA